MSMRVLGISGSLSQGSRTSTVIREVLQAAAAQGDVETELLEVSQRQLVFCDGRPPDKYEDDTREVLDLIAAADAFVAGSPMYRGSYSGAFKNLFDLVPNDAIAGKVVGLVASGGSDHHFLALEHQLRPLFSFFGAYTAPMTVYAQNAHFEGGRIKDQALLDQCRRLGETVVRLSRGLAAAR
jgi:MsuE subfamily FMN reductase